MLPLFDLNTEFENRGEYMLLAFQKFIQQLWFPTSIQQPKYKRTGNVF